MRQNAIASSANKETTISMTRFRKDMDAVLDRVYEQNEVFIVQRSGKPVAAIVHPRNLAYVYPQKPRMK